MSILTRFRPKRGEPSGALITSRRKFLLGLGCALAAPAIVRIENLMPISVRRPTGALWMPAAWLDPALRLGDLDQHGMSQSMFEALYEPCKDLVLNYRDYDPDYARQLTERIAAADSITQWHPRTARRYDRPLALLSGIPDPRHPEDFPDDDVSGWWS